MQTFFIILGVYIIGIVIAWEIYDVSGPDSSNVSAAIIIQTIKHIGKVFGTIFWPFVLLFEIIDFFMIYFDN